MLAWIKSHLIPHKYNDHHPKILHSEKVRGVLVLILFVEIFLFIFPTLINMKEGGQFAANVLPAVVGRLTNEERLRAERVLLNEDPILSYAAQLKAEDMARRGYFAHTSPDGITPWYWLSESGYNYIYAGENLAVNFSDSKDVTRAWMNSPTHRDNILKGVYTEMGTGIATGKYKGKNSTFIVQYYARPSNVAVRTNTNEVTARILGDQAVLGATSEPISLVDRLMSSPRNTTNVIFGIIALIIALSVILTIIKRTRRNHKIDIVSGALMILVLIVGLLVVNYYLSLGEVNAPEASFETAILSD